MFSKIRRWWKYSNVRYFHRDFITGIKNIRFFWRVVWRFQPYDSSFQMRLLARSLEPLADELEFKGLEVKVSRMKKVAKIRRAIEILNRQADANYIELAEQQLGYEVDISAPIFEAAPEEIQKKNTAVFNLSDKLDQQEWAELFTILRGQNHDEYVMLLDRTKQHNKQVPNDLWERWFDGSGMKGWWD